MGQDNGPLPPEFWSSPARAVALQTCDFAVIFAQVLQARGWTQGQLGAVLGYSQSWVSKVLRRQQSLTVDQVREIARRLGVPLHLLRLGPGGGDDPTNRREFGTTLALAALGVVPVPARAEVNETTAATLTAITGAQRRLDGTSPARELSRAAVSHVEMANRMLRRAGRSPFAGSVAAAVSEAAGLTAWLHCDMADIGTARIYYGLAIERARLSGHALLIGYMLGSLAVFEIDGHDAALGLALLAQAKDSIGEYPHPTAQAWLACIQALGHATLGRPHRAQRSLTAAQRAVAVTDPSEPPPWPWVFAFDEPKLAGYRALAAVRLNRPAEAIAAFAESLNGVQPAPKQRGLLMLEIATARHGMGDVDTAFDLASDALRLGVAYSSERVIQRARAFRRGHTGLTPPAVKQFDELLRSTLV